MVSSKVEIFLKKKNSTRAQIFRYFRIESRNKNLRKHRYNRVNGLERSCASKQIVENC